MLILKSWRFSQESRHHSEATCTIPVYSACIFIVFKQSRGMDKQYKGSLVLIPLEDLDLLKNTQHEILKEIKELKLGRRSANHGISGYIPALRFMKEVNICRTKFDKLVSTSKIKIIKKKRKIYVPIEEVERYFNDPTIQ